MCLHAHESFPHSNSTVVIGVNDDIGSTAEPYIEYLQYWHFAVENSVINFEAEVCSFK
jgi:hypothetical protein